jgi:hypothetical protein
MAYRKQRRRKASGGVTVNGAAGMKWQQLYQAWQIIAISENNSAKIAW